MNKLFTTSLFLFSTACVAEDLGGANQAGSEAGTGTGTLHIDAEIEASPELDSSTSTDDFTTEIYAIVKKGDALVTTGEVVVSSAGGDVALTFDPAFRGGAWVGVQRGYHEIYSFDARSGDDAVEGVVVDGPDTHTFTSPSTGATVAAGSALTITWSRAEEAPRASIETREMGETTIADSGSVTLPAGSLRSRDGETEEEEVRVEREVRVVPAGAVAGSHVDVQIENRVEILVTP